MTDQERLATIEQQLVDLRMELNEVNTLKKLFAGGGAMFVGACVWAAVSIFAAQSRLGIMEAAQADRASDSRAMQDIRGDLRELTTIVRADRASSRDTLAEIQARLARMEDQTRRPR